MKSKPILIQVAVGMLLAATLNLQALPPRQHSVNGVIQAIDCSSRTLALKPKDGATALVFVWNDTTRFSHRGGCAKCNLNVSQAVRVSYQREVGQNALREVSATGASVGCSFACKQSRE